MTKTNHSPDERQRIRRLVRKLRRAEKPLRILRTVAWPQEARERFFEQGERELPEVSYEAPSVELSQKLLAEVRGELRDDGSPVEDWLRRLVDRLEGSARMLAAVGQPAFFEASKELYGQPDDPVTDGASTTLGLARRLDEVLGQVGGMDLGAPAPACHLAGGVAETMRRAVTDAFGDQAPKVVVVNELSANALAGPRRIRIRRQACFTDLDVYQLIHHEAFVHVATSLNGRAQKELPILAASHAGTTRTQEGLAVFAEFMSGTMDPDRLRRLADRVLAIQMAVEGADFLQVYRFFLERNLHREQAFENSRRVFRGGVLQGGAPFTKDMVYLGGLLRVHNFLRTAVLAGRADCFQLLFCGKLDLEDLPALGRLAEMGLCRPPRFLPPWAADRRFLLSYLAYSGFLNVIDLSQVAEHYQQVLSEIPALHAWEGPQGPPVVAS